MTEVIVPDNERDWESFDIFLFTNGQQNLPPRKYHLRTQELNWWEATMTNLARTQFGPTHSTICLYTTDGHKIGGPLELRNGMAYVAVKPPDTFIDAGYDKYIIKSTRSWEKRQAKRTGNIDETIPAAEIENHNEYQINDELMSIKPPEESLISDQLSTIQTNPVKEASNIQQTTKPNVPISKQIEKRPMSLAQRTHNITKTNTPNISTPNKKVPVKANENPLKKNNKIPMRTPIVPINNNLSAKYKTHPKILYKTKEIVPVKCSPPKIETRKQICPSSPANKSLLTDSSPIEDVLGDKEIVIVTNMTNNPDTVITPTDNPDTEITPTNKQTNNSVQKEQIGIQYSRTDMSIDVEVQTLDKADGVNQSRVSFREDLISNNKTKPMFTPNDPSNNIVPNPIEEKYVTFMNKGDVINLKLLIEIRSGDNIVQYRAAPKTLSLINVLKTEKGSQVSVEEEVFIQSKSLQSVLGQELLKNERVEEPPKVVIVQCCCSQLENDLLQMNIKPECRNCKRCIILLPWIGSTDGCHCDTNVKENIEKHVDKLIEPRKSSVYCPVKPSQSQTSLERLGQKKSEKNGIWKDIDTVILDDIGPKPGNTDNYIASPVNTINSSISQLDHLKNLDGTKRKVTITAEDAPPAELEVKSINLSQATKVEESELIVVEKESFIESPKREDKSTETNLSDLVLEARRHDDGCYTFHLPPLQLLKQYHLIQ